MCPVFIGSSMKPLSTSFQRFSPIIVNFLEQPSQCQFYRLPPDAWRLGCFSPGFFRRWSPNVNLYELTCFPTFCQTPRLFYRSTFSRWSSFTTLFLLSRCASSCRDVYLHLRQVYFGRSPVGLLPVFTSSADSSVWTFSATAQFLRLSPIGLAGLFASVRVRRLF